MKLRELLRRIDLSLRPPHVQEEGRESNRPIDNVDAIATAGYAPYGFDSEGGGPQTAPPNWVPSQQDERPRH